jgi:hypothetical protein
VPEENGPPLHVAPTPGIDTTTCWCSTNEVELALGPRQTVPDSLRRRLEIHEGMLSPLTDHRRLAGRRAVACPQSHPAMISPESVLSTMTGLLNVMAFSSFGSTISSA